MAVTPIIVDNLASSLTAERRVYPQTKWCLPPLSVSEGWHPTIGIYSLVYHGLVCRFLVIWLQIAIEHFALFHHSVYDYRDQTWFFMH